MASRSDAVAAFALRMSALVSQEAVGGSCGGDIPGAPPHVGSAYRLGPSLAVEPGRGPGRAGPESSPRSHTFQLEGSLTIGWAKWRHMHAESMQPEDIRAELARHHGVAYGWALSCCEWERVTAEDVLHTSYLKVLEGRARFGGRSSFKTWLFAVIRRTAGEYRRRHLARRILPLPRANGRPETVAPGGVEDALVRSETATRLRAALRALPRRQRELMLLVFYQELTVAESASVLGISVGTARTHYQRGKQRLRKLLAGEEHDGAR